MPGTLALRVRADGNLEPGPFLFERHHRPHFIGEARALELEGERHGEAAGVSRRDQLLGLVPFSFSKRVLKE